MASLVILLISFLAASDPAGSIVIATPSATVWSPAQTVRGEVQGIPSTAGSVLVNGIPFPFSVGPAGGPFTAMVRLQDGVNTVVAVIDSLGTAVASDTVRLTLGYRLRPEVEATAAVSGGQVSLRASILGNPDSARVTFQWWEDPANPRPLGISPTEDSVASAPMPQGTPPGEYLFCVRLACEDGDTVVARAMVTVDSSGARAFQAATDAAAWIDSAVVYGITPYNFVSQGRFTDITAKVPEIASLGVTALWLQPVYATYYGGQGYDVIDYFGVRSDLGTESDLRELIQEAHRHGLRVLFDFVPNHTSIRHPYAEDSRAGTASHYYDFYQRTTDAAPYSQHYKAYQGFINYFWNELPNLNYGNPEVRTMILESAKYWVENFGIDGYRVDVAWGVNARDPAFFREWRLALKRLHPRLLLLGEDKATWPMVFEERFDAAYDWAPEQSWVSHWVWQTSYSTSGNPTIFNYPDQDRRASLLRSSLTNAGAGYASKARIFRFLENNDTFRFLATHDLPRTKMAAALMFALPGIPSIFNGQEIGAPTHPYNTSQVFQAGSSIQAQDAYGLVPFYATIARMRTRFPALRSRTMEEVPVTPGTSIYAFRRWEGKENILCLMNMRNAAQVATVNLPVAAMGLDSAATYYLSDQVTNTVAQYTGAELASASIAIPAYTTRVYVIDTRPVTSVEPVAAGPMPESFSLDQNYPNPFNPSTTIRFEVPARGPVRLGVFDILGQELRVLADGIMEAGRHMVVFDASAFPSGVYFYRIEAGGHRAVRKMLLVR